MSHTPKIRNQTTVNPTSRTTFQRLSSNRFFAVGDKASRKKLRNHCMPSCYTHPMPKRQRDENTVIVRAVERVTGTKPVRGEDLLPARLAKKLREVKAKEAARQDKVEKSRR